MEVALAEKFVKKAGNYTEYNINIMDENGIIIASSNAERVGSFHEVAYQLLKADKDVVEVVSADHFQGGRTGINMALVVKKQKIGVLGITGEPDEIRDLAKVIKMSLETMLEYEEQNKKLYHQQNLRTRFIDGLLYQEEADIEGELTAVSEQLGYSPHLVRIPILMMLNQMGDAYQILECIKKSPILSNQDISTVTRNNHILIYRSFSPKAYKDYRYAVSALIEKLDQCVAQFQNSCRYYIGTFQENYQYYRAGFQHSTWLAKHYSGDGEPIHFFYDYVGDYMRSMAPMYELNRIYAAVCEDQDEKNRQAVIELIEALRKNNYNLNATSKELFVHKNTLIFRYNKVKEMYNVNPIQNTADREFLDWLALYLKVNR